ncbi:glycosyltransferase family 9 protein [Chryseolinea sp. H1M3-3]|uniref:glycosyltransferase family 9 protein n=1 Tax=Chryseolinea sp. H1M3-3 TaxID=3034144 RepID=UPI0023EDBF9D|nr:glycosyltransferase family 9 protein [Chryseolinea sp. H1M3-3]
MKALIICGSTLAEAVFATPIIRTIKVQLDDVEVHVLAHLSSAFTLDENPYVDQIHFSQPSVWKNFRRLKSEKFDLVINLREDWASKALALLLNSKAYHLKSIRWKRWLMINLKIDQLPNQHLVNRMFDSLEGLKIKPDELGLDYFIPEKDKVAREWLPADFQQGYFVFCIGASYNTRKLTVDRMIELCDKINKPIVLLGSKQDFEIGEVVSSFFGKSVSISYEEGLLELNKRTIVYNACGKFNFNQMASVVRQSRGVFTFDNEFIAVASAFKKEIIGLWGNTILLFGGYPYRTKFTVLENNRISCRPCTARGYDKCPKGHFKCMNRIVFDFYLP